jgi:signal-transduction protein with cAMP-binding, CBS, and nucleotidyltransferase domain
LVFLAEFNLGLTTSDVLSGVQSTKTRQAFIMTEHAEVEIVRHFEPVMLPPSATVMMAARHMHSRNISAVLVVEGDAKLVGIFTERDAISRVLAAGSWLGCGTNASSRWPTSMRRSARCWRI